MRPLSRSIASWPRPRKNRAISQPFTPGAVKYADLARKVSLRDRTAPRRNESENERWLLTKIAGPAGMLLTPLTSGRSHIRSNVRTVALKVQYIMRIIHHRRL